MEHARASAQSAQSAKAISTQSILIHASLAELAQAYALQVLSKRLKIITFTVTGEEIHPFFILSISGYKR